MAEVTWVLERDVFSEECFNAMITHFKENNIPYHIVRIIPFIHEIEGKVPVIEGPVVCYGSIGIQELAVKHGWNPAVWTGPNFSEDALIKKLGKQAINNDAVFCKFSEVLEKTDLDLFFIKPNTDTKEFAGTLLSRDEIKDWTDKLIAMGYVEEDIILDLEVAVSAPIELGAEWRFVIVDGKISSYSYYKQYQRVMPKYGAPEDVIEYVSWIVAQYGSPAPVFVIDVVEVPAWQANPLRVIEYNTFNSAGLYKCDVRKIIDDVNEYVGRISNSNT